MNYELRPLIPKPSESSDGQEALKKDSERSQLLLEFNNAVVSQLDLDSLLTSIFDCIKRVFTQTIAASLSIHNPETNELRVHLLHSDDPELLHKGKPISFQGTPSGLAFTSQQVVLVRRLVYEDFPTDLIKRGMEDGIKSACAIPLVSHNRVVGTMTLGSLLENGYSDADADLLAQVGLQIAMPIENALNFRSAQRERDRNQLLLDINNAVASTLDIAQLLEAISKRLQSVIPHDATGLAVWDEEINQLRMHSAHIVGGNPLPISEGSPIPIEGTPSGLAYKTRQTVLRDRTDFEEFHYPAFRQAMQLLGLNAGCSAPLILEDRVIGVISLSSRKEAAFTQQDVNLLEEIGGQLAIAVENARNFRRAQRERERAEILLEVNNAITTNLDLHDLIHATANSLRRYFKQDFAGISLYNDEINQMTVHSIDSSQPEEFLIEGEPFQMEGTLNGLAFTTQKPVVRNRIDPAESSWPLAKQFFEEHGLKSVCFAPMISGGETVGVLSLGNRQENAFSDENVSLLVHIAGQISIAVRNSLNFDRAKKAKERAQILLEANNAVTTSLDLKDLLNSTAACLRDYFNHDVTGLALYDESRSALIVHTVDRQELSVLSEGSVAAAEGTPVIEAFTSGRPVLDWRFDFDKYPAPQMRTAYELGWRSGCSIPLMVRDRPIGVLSLVSLRENGFTNIATDLLISIAGQVALAVENTLQYRQIEALKNKLASEKHYLEEEIKTRYNFAEIVGQSDSLRGVLRQVETVAPTDSTVLLIGETGTGKELIARAIHNLSERKERTLVKLNCAAIPTGLLESELFGHEKGAFTGAIAPRVGRFELAHKGSLLLDEIGEIPLELQPKLLRVLQEQEFERLGSSRTIKTDTRLIAATNCDLAQMVNEKQFRSDLYYRLNVFPILIPPLRQRTGDIPLLVGYFTHKHATRMNKKIQSVPAATMEALCNYHWPGNVRELENFIERSVILSSGAELQSPLTELQPASSGNGKDASGTAPRQLTTMDEMEKAYIEEVLRHVNGAIAGKGGAAEILGMPSSTLRSRMKKLGLK